MNLLVTGGCGFIGSNFVKMVLDRHRDSVSKVVNVDALTYAGSLQNTKDFQDDEKYVFEEVDLRNASDLLEVFERHSITHVVHLAAESHVDKSIDDPSSFVTSNVVGTHNLLKISRRQKVQRFHHVSTDEVYGELGDTGKFNEESPYNPKNPYSASKASSDFIARSYYHTYGFPVTISNCSNNYGPHQNDEKFIPTVIRSVLQGKKIPLYGAGLNVRDWIYVEDHCDGIWKVFTEGKLGETYCMGADCEKKNIEMIQVLCHHLQVVPEECIEHVTDRLGHDFRYAIDNTKIQNELGWTPRTSFEEGIASTVRWYNERY